MSRNKNTATGLKTPVKPSDKTFTKEPIVETTTLDKKDDLTEVTTGEPGDVTTTHTVDERPFAAIDSPFSFSNKNVTLDNAATLIRTYIDEMAVGAVSNSKICGRNQVGLYTAITSILHQDGDVFNTSLDEFLAMMHANIKGIFSISYVNRGIADVTLPKVKREMLLRLLSLFATTCNPATRAEALRTSINFEFVLESIRDAKMQQRLLNYYK